MISPRPTKRYWQGTEGALRAARTFLGDRNAPRAVSSWFRGLAVEAGLTPGRLADAELCLDEIVTNIVRHARGEGPSRTLRVRLEREEGAFLIVVEDDGSPFDPGGVLSAPMASNLDEAVAGGRGLLLVRASADGLRYERQDGRNRVTLVFRDPASS